MEEITGQWLISRVLTTYPATGKVFESYCIECLDCPAVSEETLHFAAIWHHLDLEGFLADLNAAREPDL